MSRPERIAIPTALAALALLGWLAVWWSSRPPEGPVEPDWDHSACARCGMLLSERGFAAQVQLDDGRLLHYDDPGCLLAHRVDGVPPFEGARAVWFHHRAEPRWISSAEVGFESTEHSPMDFGLAAVERAARPGAFSLDEARRRALEGARGLP